MTKVKSALKTISFIYDFAVDGGATGSIPMGVYLPSNAMVLGTFIQSITDITSAGAAIVDVGTLAGSTILSNFQSGTSGTFADYNSGTYGFAITQHSRIPGMNAVSQSGGLISPNDSSEIVVSIEPAAALTGGSFKCLILYAEF